ncbi:putative beta-N-hexosaminidase [Xylariomycetidae sp. FL2044]|nr:putative beta-N-hexosaminidase [Xylariomycetidae sp. FL2044]
MYIGFFTILAVGGASALQTLPPTSREALSSNGTLSSTGFILDEAPTTIYITSELASRRDIDGLTLIPPSGEEFATGFIGDLASATGKEWKLEIVDQLPSDTPGIFLDTYRGAPSILTYENGRATEEGYILEAADDRVVISASGARGMYWGTRTLIQELMLSNWSSIPTMKITDAPAYPTRGFMLDAGRKFYSLSLLKDLCTYASFFKMSEFHYHTSDNYPLNRGHNETWNDVYAQFSLRPESEDLQGLVQRPNETLSRADFEDLQAHCARRGITVIPEIEAPGHCLTITKWKPELALEKKDLLNLTHPDSIPTVKRIWQEFLPWIQSKEVHIGADEYDSSLADDYITFVNEMSQFINETSGKRIRIWGTAEPSENLTISKEIIIQHWQYGQSDPVQLQRDGYDLINSQDSWAYMSLKNDHTPINPAPYPQFFDESRVLNFAGREDWQWTPAIFNPVNLTEQLVDGARGNKGAIMAAWNDNGPDATTQLEAYYAMRRGIPLEAARAWSGARGPALDAGTVDSSLDFLSANAPGQNLDRNVKIQGNVAAPGTEILSWTRGQEADSDMVELGYGSKGMNYTLTISATGPFTLSSQDATLSLTEEEGLVYTADDYTYPLRSTSEGDGFEAGHPGRIWTNASSSTHEAVTIQVPAQIVVTGDAIGGSRVWVDGAFQGRFEAFVYGGRNTVFSWSQMAFVAPLQTLQGGVQSLSLSGEVLPPTTTTTTASNGTSTTPAGGSDSSTTLPTSSAATGYITDGRWNGISAGVALSCAFALGRGLF